MTSYLGNKAMLLVLFLDGIDGRKCLVLYLDQDGRATEHSGY